MSRPKSDTGVWVAYHSDYSGFAHSDYSGFAVFRSELAALRHAVDNHMYVAWSPWGSLSEGINAWENRERKATADA